jgi:hypothetical protein
LPWWPWRIVATVAVADEVPDKLPYRGAVLVGSPTYHKWLVFDCPCRSGHRIMVTLDSHHSPHWRISKDMRLSLWPSVDATFARKRCHYIIRNGMTIWVHDKE